MVKSLGDESKLPYNKISLKLSYVIGMENDIQTSAVSRIYFSNFIFNIQTFAWKIYMTDSYYVLPCIPYCEFDSCLFRAADFA